VEGVAGKAFVATRKAFVCARLFREFVDAAGRGDESAAGAAREKEKQAASARPRALDNPAGRGAWKGEAPASEVAAR
jgi:hypothetical protein